MAQYELLLPKMGESVAEATIIKWTKQPGDQIKLDDTILEIATDKVDSEVPSPVEGKLVKQLFSADEVVQVGAVIAIIETDAASTEAPAVTENKVEEIKETAAVEEIPGISQISHQPQETSQAQSDFKASERFYSPLVKNIAKEEGISVDELDNIKGSGAEGRLTKEDLLAYVQQKKGSSSRISETVVQARAEVNRPAEQKVAQPASAPVATSVTGGDEIIEMDRMRKLIADHMVMSKHTSPHVTSFVEADVTNLVLWRNKVKKTFEQRENEKITFTPIFVEAVAKAIKDFPMINVSVNGTQIIKKKDINISGNLHIYVRFHCYSIVRQAICYVG